MAPRRAALAQAAALLGCCALLGLGGAWVPSAGGARDAALTARRAAEEPAASATPAAAGKPVVAVLGAGGRTGALVVDALLKAGAQPLALTRSGKWTSPSGAAGAQVGTADVTSDVASIAAAIAGASAVVWAAAYSRGKSLPKDVDNAGLVKTARAVREAGIGRLVVVSSAATTRPYAPVGILLNTIGSNVLMEKLQGESEMKGILAGSKSTYTIIKPGGLKMDEAEGFEKLEFNQGDTFVGSIPRADVAEVAAAAAVDPENRGAGKTFEMYLAKSRNGLLPWYGDTKYVVDGSRDCGKMLGALLEDEKVTDVPGFLPF